MAKAKLKINKYQWWGRDIKIVKSVKYHMTLSTFHLVTGDGVLFSLDFFVYFFLSLFLCQQDYAKTAGSICMKFSGKVWRDHGTT